MSNEAVGWALKLDLSDASAKLVLVILADHWRDDTDSAWPSVARIARISGADDRTVQRALARLIRKKVIKREKRKGTSSIFRLIFDPRQNDVPYVEHPRRNAAPPSVNLSPPPRQNVTLSSQGTSQSNSERKLTSKEEWKKRVEAYDPRNPVATWKPFWGRRPDASLGDGILIPPDVLLEWRGKNPLKRA